MRIAVIGFCHAPAIGDALMHLLEDAEVPTFNGAAVHLDGKLAEAEKALESCDVVFAQPMPDAYGPLSMPALRARFPRLVTLPVIAFTGFHPDCIYLGIGGRNHASPIGPYHSALVAGCYAAGLPAERVAPLFNAYVFRRLGYFEEFAKARAFLAQEMEAHGLDLEQAWPHWMAGGGAFMHTINHPKAQVLASLATLGAVKAGLVPPGTKVPALAHDELSLHAIWPVYPELAAAIGVPGSLLFKRHGAPDEVRGSGVLLRLRDFIARSYAMYAHYPREIFETGAAAEVRKVLASILDLPG